MGAFYIWLIIGIILFIVEIFISEFVLMSFGVGCIFAAFAALFGIGIIGQLTVFIIVTVLIFLSVRPVLAKYLQKTGKQVKTNAEALVGKVGQVIETIDSKCNTGRVLIGGEDWRAVADVDQKLESGCKVKVLGVDGAKVIVAREA